MVRIQCALHISQDFWKKIGHQHLNALREQKGEWLEHQDQALEQTLISHIKERHDFVVFLLNPIALSTVQASDRCQLDCGSAMKQYGILGAYF